MDLCYALWAFNVAVACEYNASAASAQNFPIPPYGGANFVNVNLCIVVVNAPGTLFAFKPDHVHGTTISGGTTYHELTFTFLKRISDALAELGDRTIFGESQWGAGDGNIDHEWSH
ncbi:hypothetical protein BT96DRAFT_928761 [Gymnopus androsaceus JB14]|uniref:Uncharacterized protein n=1 Tax=Gymnopus androsaceus JB14 TaxID=1447944 RepID=A0A6A4GIU4_9AGAR|nr:hypothetical protein BT96DRAFT_928761 [Gymnopus androsaceus JB14]